MKHLVFSYLVVALLVPATLQAQIDTVYVPPEQGSLNDSIQAYINAGRLSETVFELKRDGRYVLTNSVTTPADSSLTIVAPNPGVTQATAPPQILWTPNTAVLRNFIFDCYGNVTLKNLWILYADTDGVQVSTSIEIEDDSTADISGAGERATFDGVIFDYGDTPPNGGGCVTITARHFKGIFENCYFRNDIDPRLRYYGRALSFPYDQSGYHSDSVSFENCTFANLGYVYQQEDGDYGDYVSFNHCTFMNIMMFAIESGWWKDLTVTNCIFENTFMFGTTPAEGVPFGGTIYIDSVAQFGFSVPFADQQRHILFADNSYDIQPWLVNWMQDNPYTGSLKTTGQTGLIPVPQPMTNTSTLAFFDTTNSSGARLFPNMNMINAYDSVSPHFVAPPTNTDSIKQFLYEHWSADNSVNWAFQPGNDVGQVWPMEENLAYTNDTLLSAGMSGFPLGDLYHWFPADYGKWKAQAAQEHQEISNALFPSGILITSGLGIPRLISPSNAEVGLADKDTLTWSKVSGATGYHLQVSIDLTFGNASKMAVNDSSVADTSDVVRVGLGTPYYWRVLAYTPWTKSAYSPVDTFTTKLVAATEIPNPVSPLNGSTDVIPAVELVCARKSDASQFHWQVRTDTMFTSAKGFVVNDSTVDTTNAIDPLLPGTKYYWRVQGVNPLGVSPFSPVDSFTVMPLPGTPVTVYPGQDAMHIPPDTLTLTWHAVQNESGYVCRIWTGLSTVVSMIQDSTKDTSLTVTNLEELAKYYWQVVAYNPAGISGYSPADSFTTTVNTPPSPAAIYPDGNAGEPRMATFLWKGSASAVRYELQVASNSAFTPVIVDTTVTDTLIQISDTLAANRTFYWRVAGIDAGGTGAFSAAVPFVTGSGVLGIKLTGGIPAHFALLQNFPNPFNPSTTIRFALKENSSVTLAIYNVLGQRVETFDLGRMSAGIYDETVGMSRFASGVYFYRIDAVGGDGKSFVALKKMVMIK